MCPWTCIPTDTATRKALEEQYLWIIDALERYALGEALACLVRHLEAVMETLQRGEDAHREAIECIVRHNPAPRRGPPGPARQASPAPASAKEALRFCVQAWCGGDGRESGLAADPHLSGGPGWLQRTVTGLSPPPDTEVPC